MRLCLVTPGFSAAEDDWCIPALHHLVRRLAADHDVTVLALRHPPRGDEYGFFGARVLPFAIGTRTGAWRVALLLRALATIRREHRPRAFDVIHGLWADEAGFIAATAGRWLGVRSVVSIMGGEVVGFPDLGYGVQLGRTGRRLVRHSLARADLATVGSTGLIDAAVRLRKEKPLAVTPLGVDLTVFEADGSQAELDGDPCLIHVGSLTPIKNHRLSIAAFHRVAAARPEARLHLVGSGPMQRELAARVRALRLDDRVRFHGEVPHHDLPRFYRSADLNLVSSYFESQGMTILEAAACGTATVGTEVGILPDLGPVAVTSPTDEADALASALLGTLAPRSRIRELGAAARDLVRAELGLDDCTARLVAAYSGSGGEAWPGRAGTGPGPAGGSRRVPGSRSR
jgi:glycosyltransferase involved in cell wall biosynthesis